MVPTEVRRLSSRTYPAALSAASNPPQPTRPLPARVFTAILVGGGGDYVLGGQIEAEVTASQCSSGTDGENISTQ